MLMIKAAAWPSRGFFEPEARGMKRKGKAKKRNNESYGKGILVVFLITLCLVLSIGVAGLIAYKVLNGDVKETYRAKEESLVPEKKNDFELFQEKIPDRDDKDRESTDTGEEAGETAEPAGRYDG